MKTFKANLCVAGGGLAGICAAVSAARHGLKVVLVNDRSVLGGNASSEIGVGVSGASHHGLNTAIYAKETGIVSEFRMKVLEYTENNGMGKLAALDATFFDMVYGEENITLLLNTTVTACESKDGHIEKCYALHTFSNEKYTIEADYFVDSTGNGILAFEAGATYRMGREGKNEFGEFWAPDEKDDFTMGSSLYFETEIMDSEVIYKRPKFAYDITDMDFVKIIDKPGNFRGFSVSGPHWAYEFGGQKNTIYESEDIDFELRKLIYGIWDYIKNSGKYPKAKNTQLKRVYTKTGARESRRFEGDYILTENDIENKVDFYDSVCIGGWPMDIHAPLGIYDTSPASNFVSVTGIYNIPLRCLYSKDIDNLFLAGRDISATHIALGSTRVMATCGAMGQAVGTAASLCKKYDISPRRLVKERIEELQTMLLQDDQTIIGKIDCINGGFTASATSEKNFENTDFNEYIPLERDYALALMCDNDRIDNFEIKINAIDDTELKCKILTGTHPETFLPDCLVKEFGVNVSKGERWITIPCNTLKGNDGKIYIVFCENKDIRIAIGKTRPVGAVTFRMHTNNNQTGKNHDSAPLNINTSYIAYDHAYEKQRNILFKNLSPASRMYSADKVLNGYARPYKETNLWIAEKDFPQTLTLKADNPIYADRLSIVFDDFMENDAIKKVPGCLVKDFNLKVKTTSNDMDFSVKSNYQRVCNFNINAQIIEIIITINESHGDDAGIFGIRIK
ncbi:MAG: FAD-dependent oxidoreductase [Clostridia bacterium]|nr:FAD-dependent oxidoreductase [Clostridia bacterium]